jgi:hypothetical protein
MSPQPSEITSVLYRNIDKLPRTIEDAAKEIQKLTGWACTIMVGGPMPRMGGAIQALV